jgi:hypothetical protein
MDFRKLKGAMVNNVLYFIEDLAAGADIADRPFFVVPTGYKFVVESAKIISQGTAAGIDDSNTAVILIENGSNQIASKTFNATVTFPASGAVADMGTITNATLAAGELLTVSVTNGATANTPLFGVQVNGYLEKVAVQ